jgi:hypothetical protein
MTNRRTPYTIFCIIVTQDESQDMISGWFFLPLL